MEKVKCPNPKCGRRIFDIEEIPPGRVVLEMKCRHCGEIIRVGFPCTAAVAKKVFPLIGRFAKEDDKEKLCQFLRIKAREHSGKVRAFSEKADSLTAKSEEWYFYRRKAREEQIIYNQCIKNLKLLEGRKE